MTREGDAALAVIEEALRQSFCVAYLGSMPSAIHYRNIDLDDDALKEYPEDDIPDVLLKCVQHKVIPAEWIGKDLEVDSRFGSNASNTNPHGHPSTITISCNPTRGLVV